MCGYVRCGSTFDSLTLPRLSGPAPQHDYLYLHLAMTQWDVECQRRLWRNRGESRIVY